jgi:hypothetical protein
MGALHVHMTWLHAVRFSNADTDAMAPWA